MLPRPASARHDFGATTARADRCSPSREPASQPHVLVPHSSTCPPVIGPRPVAGLLHRRSRALERQLPGRRPRPPACEVLMTVSVQPALAKAQSIGDALPWLARHQGRTIVIKLGGHAMVDEDLTAAFARDVVFLRYAGLRPVVVHGGGPQID